MPCLMPTANKVSGSWCQHRLRSAPRWKAAFRLAEPIQQVAPEIVPHIIYLASQPDGTEPPKWRLEDSPIFLFGVPLIGGRPERGRWRWAMIYPEAEKAHT
jgi:hypothetical protein